MTLRYLQRSEEALAAYDDVMKLFGESSNPKLQDLVAKALMNKDIGLR